MALFNVAKLVFIYKKFGILPFDKSYAKLILVLNIVFFGIYAMPKFENLWIEVTVKGATFLLVTLSLVFQMQLIPAMNFWFNKFLNR